MKKVLFVLIFSFAFQFANSEMMPKYHYKVDLKTKFKDKAELKPLKQGLKALMERSQYFELGEFGEDFSLWIKSPYVNKVIETDGRKHIYYSCLLEMRTPAAFGKGKYIASKNIKIDYYINKEELAKLRDPKNVNIGKLILDIVHQTTGTVQQRKIAENLSVVGFGVGIEMKLMVASINETCEAFTQYFDTGDPLDYKAEFYIVGKKLYNELINMVVSAEK